MGTRLTNISPERRAKLDKAREGVERYKARHPDRVLEQHRRTYAKNHGKILDSKHRYDEANRDRLRAYARDYHRTHAEQEKAYVARNADKLREYRNAWCRARYRANPSNRMRKLLTNRLNKYLIKLGGTRGSMARLIGCSWEELRFHIESQFTDGMAWSRLGEIHIDHIRPCVSFNLSDPEQQKECFHYTNLQPLWAADNQRKGGKVWQAIV